MTTALAVRDDAALMVTPDQLELIKRTVANGATADELKLYLFDCQRQGVHPLDKLVHFTKRAGKYTPITSIDFMRIRAAETNEYAGSDDAVFGDKHSDVPSSATVTVWRIVQGTRCPFTATARWSEYKPDQNDFMWKKMPHTMLAKCAEALALRKGFPRQLAGLYAKEEMDQAGPVQTGYVVEAPAPTGVREKPAARLVENSGALPASSSNGKTPDFGSGDAGSIPAVAANDEGPDHGVDMPEGARRILRVNPGAFGAKGFVRLNAPGMGNETEYPVYSDQLKALAEQLCQNGEPCFVDYKQAAASKKWRIQDLMRVPANYDPMPALREAEGGEEGPF